MYRHVTECTVYVRVTSIIHILAHDRFLCNCGFRLSQVLHSASFELIPASFTKKSSVKSTNNGAVAIVKNIVKQHVDVLTQLIPLSETRSAEW